MSLEEKRAAVNKDFKSSCEIKIPEVDKKEIDESIDDKTPKGKIKALFRKFESKMQKSLRNHLASVNSQLDNIHAAIISKLDKKYGGMYKILINTFLTNIETKIHNNEITIEAMRRLLKEEFKDKDTENRIQELRTQIHNEVEEARNKAIEEEKNEQQENANSKDDGESSKKANSTEGTQDDTNEQS